MFRYVLCVLLAVGLFAPRVAAARDEGPPISITSPDQGTTFAYGTVKSHTLFWSKRAKMLVARITFTDAQQNIGQPNDDTHDFTLPGVTYDEAKGIFYATSKKGEVIPVAHIKKELFIKTIEALPNANVRIQRIASNVTVVLEAISPNDPAMKPAPVSDPDGTHKVDINKVLN